MNDEPRKRLDETVNGIRKISRGHFKIENVFITNKIIQIGSGV